MQPLKKLTAFAGYWMTPSSRMNLFQRRAKPRSKTLRSTESPPPSKSSAV